MARGIARRPRTDAAGLPQWIRPQLTELVDAAPDGPEWLHEIKYDGYRMHSRLDPGAGKLLSRTRLSWTHKSPATAAAVTRRRAVEADGGPCEPADPATKGSCPQMSIIPTNTRTARSCPRCSSGCARSRRS